MTMSENQTEICCICLESSVSIKLDKMYTTCNHFFHKKCLYKACKDNEKFRCCVCRVWQRFPLYEKENIEWYQIDKNIKLKLLKIEKAMGILCPNTTEYVISGGFSVYMMQKLRGKSPSWKAGDVDIYIPDDSDFLLNYKVKGLKIVFNDMSIKIDEYYDKNKYKNCTKYNYTLNNITTVIKYTVCTGDGFFHMDLIFVKNPNKIYRIVEEFDLDCCKVAFKINRSNIKMYIHRDFYIDGFKLKNNDFENKKTELRIKNYRNRGFSVNNEF